MLRKGIWILVATLITTSSQGQDTFRSISNKIDSLQSIKAIGQFLVSLDPSFSTFHLNEDADYLNKRCNTISDSLHCKPWYKADFDHNGYTDLLVTGRWDDHAIFCILDSGDNKFIIKRLTRKIFQDCTFPVVKSLGNENVLVYYSYNAEKESGFHAPLKIDTLVYKFGDFIEYNPLNRIYRIDKIEFKTNGCFGQCPQFNLTIEANRNARYNAIKYNSRYGLFHGVIDEAIYGKLIQLLCYLDFPNLKNNYSVNWTDDQSCELSISYDDGKIKTIADYGLHGSFGLERVYQILFALRENQRWEKVVPER